MEEELEVVEEGEEELEELEEGEPEEEEEPEEGEPEEKLEEVEELDGAGKSDRRAMEPVHAQSAERRRRDVGLRRRIMLFARQRNHRRRRGVTFLRWTENE